MKSDRERRRGKDGQREGEIGTMRERKTTRGRQWQKGRGNVETPQ